MDKQVTEELGSALIIIGLVLTAFSVLFPTAIASGMATIGVDTTPPNQQYHKPSSSNKSAPTQLTVGKTIKVRTGVYERGSGIDDVWVNINGTRHGLTYTGNKIGGQFLEYATNWTPSQSGTLYTFEFHATDKAGNEGVTTTYGKTTPKPTGKLLVNGKDVTGKGTVWFKTKNFTFKTRVTKGASIVTGVSLSIDGSSNTMSRVSGTDTWKYSQTLSEGTHEVETVINWSTGSVTIQGITINVKGEG